MRRGAGVLAGVLALCLIAGASAFFFLRRSKPSAAPQKSTQAARAVTAVFSGTIRAQHTVSVRATVNGQVGSFLADVGQDVYEGQLLARLVNPGLETARETAAKSVENAQAKIGSLEGAIIAARLEASACQSRRHSRQRSVRTKRKVVPASDDPAARGRNAATGL